MFSWAASYSLKGQGGIPAAEAVLAALAPKIRGCAAQLGAQHVGNALYGLKEQGRSPAAGAVLAALEPKIRGCAAQLSAQTVGNALYPKVRECREALGAQEAGNAPCGLQRLGDSEDVRAFL